MTDGLILTLAVLGGTGKEGPGLAFRWARAGYHVLIGSRTLEKARPRRRRSISGSGKRSCMA
jgi:predicted dinucleotide-binding enzyme